LTCFIMIKKYINHILLTQYMIEMLRAQLELITENSQSV
jgi:hypothetical protein